VIETDKGTAGVVFVNEGAIGKGEETGLRSVPRSVVTRAFRVE
jgi:hypothetical protein